MHDERFQRGIALFNAADFFDAHEVWEELWQEYREHDRPFLQGLIQIAAGFYHLQCENNKGAGSQLAKGCAKLEPYAPVHLGVEVRNLLAGTRAALHSLAEAAGPDGNRSYPRIEQYTLSQ